MERNQHPWARLLTFRGAARQNAAPRRRAVGKIFLKKRLTKRRKVVILCCENKEGRCIRPHLQPSAKRSTARKSLRRLCRCADAVSIRVFILEWRCFRISKVTHQLNEEICDKEVRLIGEEGEQLGIVSSEEALKIADERGLDLVKISPQAVPPVCKLMNYGKFRFEQSKREKEARKNQHVVEIKEIRMSPGIDVGDFNTKLKNAQKFLSDGNRVKVSVRFRGREMAHTEIGRDLLMKFAASCGEVANMEKAAKLEGRNMSMFLAPKAAK